MEDIKVKDRDGSNYVVVFMLLVKHRQHLADVIRSVRQIQKLLKLTEPNVKFIMEKEIISINQKRLPSGLTRKLYV